MVKVVQTTLKEEDYKAFKEALENKGLSIREGLKLAVAKLVETEFKINAEDSFFTHKPTSRSGINDLSQKHDKYLYREKE